MPSPEEGRYEEDSQTSGFLVHSLYLLQDLLRIQRHYDTGGEKQNIHGSPNHSLPFTRC